MTHCYYQLYVDAFVIYFNILSELVIITLYCTSSLYSVFFMTLFPLLLSLLPNFEPMECILTHTVYTHIYVYNGHSHMRVGTLIVATIYLQLIQNRYMFQSFTVLQCSHQHCVQPVASNVEVVGYL